MSLASLGERIILGKAACKSNRWPVQSHIRDLSKPTITLTTFGRAATDCERNQAPTVDPPGSRSRGGGEPETCGAAAPGHTQAGLRGQTGAAGSHRRAGERATGPDQDRARAEQSCATAQEETRTRRARRSPAGPVLSFQALRLRAYSLNSPL